MPVAEAGTLTATLRALALAAMMLTVTLPTMTAEDVPADLTAPASLAQDGEDLEDTGLVGDASEPVADVTGPLDVIVAPTNAAPTFTLHGDTVTVELTANPAPHLDEGDTIDLVPSNGHEDATPIEATVQAVSADRVASQLWEGPYERSVFAIEVTVPEDPGADYPVLYDVEIPQIGEAREPRAVSVYDAWPDEPEIAVVADPQVTDPRAVGDGMAAATGVDPFAPHETEEIEEDPDLAALNTAINRTLGVDLIEMRADLDDRWQAYQDAIQRINERDPDLVLFSGDMAFGWGPELYRLEYEEAWSLLNGEGNAYDVDYEGFEVPTVLAPGNHDAYVNVAEDGFAYWTSYFGPPAFDTTFGDVHIVSVNTYDWSEMDRQGASYAVSAWGGQVREAQFDWLEDTLCSGEHDRTVTFAHHSPSWQQDLYNESNPPGVDDDRAPYGEFAEETEGIPLAEQFFRGFVAFTTTGQGWSGENRVETRDLLRACDVDAHFAGHTHRDRVARDIGNGSIVEVPQKDREGMNVTRLQLVHPRDPGEAGDRFQAIDQERARELLLGHDHADDATGPGPVYFDTTTTSSGTSQYFGWRNVTWHDGAFPDGALGIPPFETGVPMTDERLDALANDPDRWNPDHADLGLYSVPTYPGDGGDEA